MRPLLFIFVKHPVMGGAKTRLAADIGKVQTWRIHRAMSAEIIRRTSDPRWQQVLYVSPDAALSRQFSCWPEHLPRMGQGRGSLTPRLARIFSLPGPKIVIGSDAPEVCARDIGDALSALKTRDTVFGPAKDGGFWLMGARSALKPEVFDGVRWSHGETLSDLTGRLGHRPAMLRRLNDIDYVSDWRAYKSSRRA